LPIQFVPITDRVIVPVKTLRDRLAAPSIVEQQQRVGASCQARLGLPTPHRRDQFLSDACIKKAAANHAPNKNRFPPHPQAIFRLSGESRYNGRAAPKCPPIPISKSSATLRLGYPQH